MPTALLTLQPSKDRHPVSQQRRGPTVQVSLITLDVRGLYTVGQQPAVDSRKPLMSRRTVPKPPGRGRAPPSADDPPLIRVLVAESTRRGDTLEHVARELGVPYQRLAEWRRGETHLANAKRPVLRAAARYLGVPTTFVLCLAGLITLEDLVQPAQVTIEERVRRTLERARVDPRWAGFFPAAIMTAGTDVQQFVALLYHELSIPSDARNERDFQWMLAVHAAALGDAEARTKLDALTNSAPGEQLF